MRAARAGGPTSRARESWPTFLILRAAGMGYLVSLLGFIAAPERIAFAALPLPPAARWAGLAIDLACLPAIVWTFRSLGTNITDSVGVRAGATLVESGPYRFVRHPLYLFGGLAWIGMALLTSNALPFAFGLGAVSALVARTRVEEEVLEETFGEPYRAYRARTGRFLPRPGSG